MKSYFKTIALLFLLFPSINLNSQDTTIQWGTKNNTYSNWYRPTLLTEDEEGIYTYYYYDDEYYIENHTKKGEKVYVKEIDLKEMNDRTTEIEDISFLDGKFIVLFSSFDKKSNLSFLFALTYDKKTGNRISDKIKLFDVPVEKKRRKGKYYFYSSNDKSKLLINHFCYYDSEDSYKDRYKLYNSKLELLVEKTETLIEKDINYRTYNYIIDNDGSFYFVKTYSSSENYIVSYEAQKDYEKWEEKVDLSEMDRNIVIENINFKINSQNHLIVTGICTKKDTLIGCLFMKIDNKSKEIIYSKLNKFDNSLKEQFLIPTQVERNFSNIKILNKDDGGIIMIAEDYSLISIRSSNYNQDKYYYQDLIVMSFSQKGDLLWSTRVPKKQRLIVEGFPYNIFTAWQYNRMYLSFIPAISNDKILLLYNEKKTNLTETETDDFKIVTRVRNTIPVICTIDLSTGEKNTKQFFDPLILELYLKMSFSYQKNQNSDFLFLCQKGKIYKFGRISF